MNVDGRRARRLRTTEKVLSAAVPLATVDGLDGFSFGDLTRSSGVAKPTIASLYPSKLDLQLAIIQRARTLIDERVFAPVLAAPRGISQLIELGRVWIDYLSDPALVGGCFFAAAVFELDSRPGPLHEVIRDDMTSWVEGIAHIVADGQRFGDIIPTVRPDDEAMLFFSIAVTANTLIQLGSVPDAPGRASRNWSTQIDRIRCDLDAAT